MRNAGALLLVMSFAFTSRAQVRDGGSLRWSSEPEPPLRWSSQTHVTPMLRTWAGGTFGHLSGEQVTYSGGTLAIGYESLFSVHPDLNRWFYGSAFGVEARAHVLHSIDGGSPSWLIAPGLAFSSFVLPTEISQRVRFAGLFAVLIPELGIAFRIPEPDSFSLRWSAPVAWLIHPRLALELVPAMTWLTRTPRGEIEVLWQLTVGASWRQVGPLPRPI